MGSSLRTFFTSFTVAKMNVLIDRMLSWLGQQLPEFGNRVLVLWYIQLLYLQYVTGNTCFKLYFQMEVIFGLLWQHSKENTVWDLNPSKVTQRYGRPPVNALITMRWFKQSQLAIPIVVGKRQSEFITYLRLLQHPDGLIQPVLQPNEFHVQQ